MIFEGHEMTLTFKIKIADRFSKRVGYFRHFDRLHYTLYMKNAKFTTNSFKSTVWLFKVYH